MRRTTSIYCKPSSVAIAAPTETPFDPQEQRPTWAARRLPRARQFRRWLRDHRDHDDFLDAVAREFLDENSDAALPDDFREVLRAFWLEFHHDRAVDDHLAFSMPPCEIARQGAGLF